MCILCSIQRWARGVAMMLPWFVIPLIGLWALSQLLPPPFRFEITSPRLACVSVLLVTFFWYEFLMPQLSAWRVRRNARLREMRRLEAIELQKLKKTATRKCRNCLTVYKEQNPGGGRFMCSYCGHVSKRPVLDLPVPNGITSNLSPGILKEMPGKSGNALNDRVWSDDGWACTSQDNLDNANWNGDSLNLKSVLWRNSEGMVCGLNDSCIAEKSYSHIIISACKLLRSSLSSAWCVWRRIFRVGSFDDDVSVDGEHLGKLAKRIENETNVQESKSEKARRKAEEKRQARLEKEQSEEEERKQREEVARLVEKRRKLREEIEMARVKGCGPVRERQKKDVEKKCQGRKKERDRGYCKSNSDAEELPRKAKEYDPKRDTERKDGSNKCESQRSGVDSGEGYNMELGQSKGVTTTSSRANTGARYLDRVRGTLLYSSKAFSRRSLFGTSASKNTAGLKENRFNGSVNHFQSQANRRASSQSDHSSGSVTLNGGDIHSYKTVFSNQPSTVGPKKSWGQLFSRSSANVPNSTSNVISRPHMKDPSDIQSPLADQSFQAQSFDNPLDFGLPSPFTLSSFPNISINTSSGFHSRTENTFPLPGGSPKKLLPAEAELFEDPCYVPDPVSFLGPVSESLDNFQLDLGSGFGTGNKYEKSLGFTNVSAPEVIRPSPIEAPLSQLRVNDDRCTNLSWHANAEKAQNMHDLRVSDIFCNNKDGTWQMWNSYPLVQDGLIGGSLDWLLSEDSTVEDNVNRSSFQSTGSLFSNNDPVLSGTNSPVKAISRNSQNGGDIASPFLTPVEHEPLFPPLSLGDNHFGHSFLNEIEQSSVTFMSPKKSADSSPSCQSPVNQLSKNRWAAYGSGEGFSCSSTPVVKPPVGGLYSTPDVQSLWSVDWQTGAMKAAKTE